ncbi:ras-like protein family member 12 [Hetaerina americana]|uniref:ras-like protein family member 12 n=1 Tax=Hetaerina americana TaxID=62018 RepID=UPI003A7F243B
MSRHHGGGGQAGGVNVALVGAIGSGKSALTVKYITKRFINEYDPFLEDTYTKHELLDNQEVTIRVMDTCDKQGGVGPERYLVWADAYLVVYSITDAESFETAASYLDAISTHLRTVTSYETPMILVGNKADLERYRQVSTWEGRRLARRHDSSFFETSAAEGPWESVAGVFREAAKQVLKEQEKTPPPLFIEEASGSHHHGGERQRRLTPSGDKGGRKDSRGEPQQQTPSPCSLSPSSGGTRFSFLKGIVPLKGIFQSSSSNGGGSPSPGSQQQPATSSTPSPPATASPGGHHQPTTMPT